MSFEMCGPVAVCTCMGGGDCAVTLNGHSVLTVVARFGKQP